MMPVCMCVSVCRAAAEEEEGAEAPEMPVSLFLLEESDPGMIKNRTRLTADERVKSRRNATAEELVRSLPPSCSHLRVIRDVCVWCVGVCVWCQHTAPGPSWRQSKPITASALRTKVRETQVLSCMMSSGLNTTNLGTLVGLVNPRDVDPYRAPVRCPP